MTQLTVATTGGIHGMRMRVNLFDPFEARCGITIKDVSYNPVDFGEKQSIPSSDVVDLSMAGYHQATSEGILASLPADLFHDNGNKFYPDVLMPCGVASIIWSRVFAYNTDAFKDEVPETVFDVWNIEKFPGMRAFPAQAEGTLELALMASGTPRDQVHALLATDGGVQQAINKIKEIERSILWMPDYDAVVEAVASGKAVIGSAPCGRFSHAQKHNKPVMIFWDHQIYGYNYWGVLSTSTHKDEAFAFLKFIMNPVNHARHLNDVHYGSVCAAAQDYIAPENVHFMPLNPANCRSSLRHDPNLWALKGSELSSRFLKTFGLESLKAA